MPKKIFQNFNIYYKLSLWFLSLLFIILGGCKVKKTNTETGKLQSNIAMDTVVMAIYGVRAVEYKDINPDYNLKPDPEIEEEELYERRDNVKN